MSERIGADLRTTAYEHLMRLSLEYFGGRRTGDLMNRIGAETDRINVHNLPPVPDQPVKCSITKADGTTVEFEAKHTFSPEQVEWFKAGSALNIVRAKVAAQK